MKKTKYLGLSTAVLALGCTMVAPVAGATAVEKPSHDVTEAAEAARVDQVDVSGMTWESCFEIPEEEDDSDPFIGTLKRAQCSTLAAPLDYNKPDGEKYNVQVLRQPAENQDEKIGTLFINPGGPGGSAWGTALFANEFLSADVLKKFDIVGVEPRGIGWNKSAQCFSSMREMTDVLYGKLFPATYPEKPGHYAQFLQASRQIGAGCASQSNLQRHMSTAQVARDMDVVRRAVGDEKLTYLGFSYGTAIGQYYANMFPDRVRAIANDGVVDATDWSGSAGNGQKILDARLGSAVSAEAAFYEALRACDAAGSEYCAAASNDKDSTTALEKWKQIEEALKSGPILHSYEGDILDDEGNVVDTITITDEYSHAVVANMFLTVLYKTKNAPESVASVLNDLLVLKNGEHPDSAETAAAGSRIQELRKSLDQVLQATKSQKQTLAKLSKNDEEGEEEYYGEFDAFSAVVCTDGSHPMSTYSHMRQADQQHHSAPLFGRSWAWSTVHCSRDTWSAYDRSAYWGPFNKKTSAPVMYIGNQWDPATAQAQAVKAANRQPGAVLVTSRSWGHTAYGTSQCATSAIDSYLLTGKAESKTECVGDYTPFKDKLDEEETRTAAVDEGRKTITGTSPAIPVGSTAVAMGLGMKK